MKGKDEVIWQTNWCSERTRERSCETSTRLPRAEHWFTCSGVHIDEVFFIFSIFFLVRFGAESHLPIAALSVVLGVTRVKAGYPASDAQDTLRLSHSTEHPDEGP